MIILGILESKSLVMLPDWFHARKDCIDVRCGIGIGY